MRKRKNHSRASDDQDDISNNEGGSGSSVSASGPPDKSDRVEEMIPSEIRQRHQKPYTRTACIVVLGDIGHSPRMNYHAESFAKEGFLVTIIGYEGGGGIPEEIRSNPSISTIGMREAPQLLQKIPRMLAYPLKMAWLSVALTWAFLWMLVGRMFCPEFIVVQNPPAVPALGICWAYSKVLGADFVVDWHNYGFSILGMSVNERNPVYKFYKWFEEYFGGKGDHHICVTKGLKEDLKRIGVSGAVVLYDRPPERFKSLSDGEQKEFLEMFSESYFPELSRALGCEGGRGRSNGIIVSGTSWTEDEDFGILLKALVIYEEALKKDGSRKYPDLCVFITGKGPLKEYYREKIKTLGLEHVKIHLPWLKHEDYPKLLGCADLGISLHTSSSGLDLPMKVVDMFGCGLPVCAVGFESIGELVVDNCNGWVFKDEEELSSQLMKWFEGFKDGKVSLKEGAKFREALKGFQKLRWHENWVRNVGPLLKLHDGGKRSN